MIDQTTTTHTVSSSDTPLITINQISLSGRQLWAIAVTIFGLLGSGFAGGMIFVPAKASVVTELSVVVSTLQSQHEETRAHMAALTVEVGKLTEAVGQLQIVRVPSSAVSLGRKPTQQKRRQPVPGPSATAQ
jgi:hypothetical protein